MSEKINNKALFIILIITLIPCVLLLLFAVYSAIFGFDFFGTSYGFEAYALTIFIYFIAFHYIFVPCLAYQIIYAVIRVKKREGMYTPPSVGTIFLRIAIGIYICGYLSVVPYIISEMF